MKFRRDEGHEDADESPGEHDACDPLRCGKMRRDKGTRDLEQKIADKKDAGACTENFRRDPGQILRHRELCIGDVDAVNAGDDRDEEDRQDDAPVSGAFHMF